MITWIFLVCATAIFSVIVWVIFIQWAVNENGLELNM